LWSPAYGGSPWNPHWLSNLAATPQATVIADGRHVMVASEVLGCAGRGDLWPMMLEGIASLHSAEQRTDRTIALVRLTPKREA
jgi:hypothetical protein